MGGEFHFSPWIHWTNRSSANEHNGPGVYLLARFEQDPPTIVDVHDERILLVAETHDQSLDARWKQFQDSAFKGEAVTPEASGSTTCSTMAPIRRFHRGSIYLRLQHNARRT